MMDVREKEIRRLEKQLARYVPGDKPLGRLFEAWKALADSLALLDEAREENAQLKAELDRINDPHVIYLKPGDPLYEVWNNKDDEVWDSYELKEGE